ncbi:MAG: PIN domain-containing protein [Betaproteobacteria bacterium]|nr:PIN domain-containing protein [Betaproteobacteria bacterium]
MLLLLDINIILDVVFQRPGEPASSALIGACNEQHQAWVAWHSVATLAYLIERERNPAVARELVTGLLSWARVATTGHQDALQALRLPMSDFEDALQVSAAQACGADYIITRNGRDFVQSPLPALSPEEFLARHPLT